MPAWTSYYVYYKVWNEITYPYPNSNGAVWEWIRIFIPYLMRMSLLIHADIKVNPCL